MVIYGLKSCDTCRKAAKALPQAHVQDIRDTPLSDATLNAGLAAFGNALLNTRSTTWRGLDAAERTEPPCDLLRRHPALMKRPLIEDDGGALHLGWGRDVQSALL